MNAWFKTLFTLSIAHEYYENECQDFDFLIPADSQQLTRNGRLLVKSSDGVLYCVYEAESDGAAVQPLKGATLRIGLKLKNPHFSNFTQAEPDGKLALYRNRTVPGQLDGASGVKLSGAIIPHTFTKGTRPVNLKLKDDLGKVLQTDLVSSLRIRGFSYETGLLSHAGAITPGRYVVREKYATGSEDVDYYVDPELHRSGVFGVVEIKLDDTFYTAAPAFEIAFKARKQTLKYYVVARKYSNADFAKLSVSDLGFGEDKRAEVTFTRVTSGSFAASDLSPALFSSNGDSVVLFKSDAAQARQNKARKKIQLNSNSDVLIPHLPAPPQEKARADLIIHVAKP